jgi:CubicO group peptidase (beta-lactamase class C family)
VTPDTDFMLASISKTFVATAAMQQVEAGSLSLSADVDSYLPFAVRNPSYPDDPITLFQLLTHTSSIRDYYSFGYDYGADSDLALRDAMEGYLVPGGAYYDENGFNYGPTAPGARYQYSNIATSLAALLVEESAATPFDAYCDANIFAPLGMNRTSWKLAGTDQSTLAMPYRYDSPTASYEPYGHYGYPEYPCGQLRTSVSQLGRFLALSMNGGVYRGVRLLQQATVTQMLTPQVDALERGQGLTWYWAGRLVGHSGGDKGVTTHMYFDPATGAGVILLANCRLWPGTALLSVRAKLLEEAPSFERRGIPNGWAWGRGGVRRASTGATRPAAGEGRD